VDGVWLEVDPPAFGVESCVPLVAPGVVPDPGVVLGKDPHGDPLGEAAGVAEVFGLTVEGCVFLGVFGF
jgi:hypothetical protein